jgi:hypothetical protein
VTDAAACTHPERADGVCTTCGDCAHDVILNGACLGCGRTDLVIDHKAAKAPADPPLVPADRLRRR